MAIQEDKTNLNAIIRYGGEKKRKKMWKKISIAERNLEIWLFVKNKQTKQTNQKKENV